MIAVTAGRSKTCVEDVRVIRRRTFGVALPRLLSIEMAARLAHPWASKRSSDHIGYHLRQREPAP